MAFGSRLRCPNCGHSLTPDYGITLPPNAKIAELVPPKGALPLERECSPWFSLGVAVLLGVMLVVFLVAVARAG